MNCISAVIPRFIDIILGCETAGSSKVERAFKTIFDFIVKAADFFPSLSIDVPFGKWKEFQNSFPQANKALLVIAVCPSSSYHQPAGHVKPPAQAVVIRKCLLLQDFLK